MLIVVKRQREPETFRIIRRDKSVKPEPTEPSPPADETAEEEPQTKVRRIPVAVEVFHEFRKYGAAWRNDDMVSATKTWRGAR